MENNIDFDQFEQGVNAPVDTSNFDLFMQMDDIKFEDNDRSPKKAKTTKTTTKDPFADLASKTTPKADMLDESWFDGLNNDEDESEKEKWYEEDEEDGQDVDDGEEDEHSEDDEEDEDSDDSDEDSDDEEGDEPVELDPDTIITLDDGSEVPFEELAKSYKDQDEINRGRQELDEITNELEARAKVLMKAHSLSILECDDYIKRYENVDWQKLARDDPQAYVANKEFLEGQIARKNELVNLDEQLKLEEKRQKEAERAIQNSRCVAELKLSIPEWSDPLYNLLTDYAINEMKDDEEDVLLQNNPSYWKAMYKAWKLDNSSKINERMAAKKNPKRVVSSRTRQEIENEQSQKLSAKRKLNNGQMSAEEAFKFLED